MADAQDFAGDDGAVYGLVMPFVCCESQGGTCNDFSFVAGVAFGQHDAELRACPGAQSWSAYVVSGMVPQYDLLAMHHGFTMKVEPWDEHPEWTLVTFTRDSDFGGQR